MFLLSKLLVVLTQPLAWVAAVLLLSLFLQHRRPRVAQRLLWMALGLLLLIGWMPLPDQLLRSLEDQSAEIPPQADLRAYAGMVILGGATESGRVAQSHQHPLMNNAAERMTVPVAMLRRNPHLQLIYSGGEGEWLGSGPSEAVRAQGFFDSMGLPAGQVRHEAASRNTYENAILSARLPGVDTAQAWLLVTSASHMPRALATFTKAGWNVTPYPVDFRTANTTPWNDYSLDSGVDRWQLALHEWVGLLAYYLTGRL